MIHDSRILIGFGWIEFWNRKTARDGNKSSFTQKTIQDYWWENVLYIEQSIRNSDPAIGIADQSSQIPNVFKTFWLNIELTVHRFAPHLMIKSMKGN